MEIRGYIEKVFDVKVSTLKDGREFRTQDVVIAHGSIEWKRYTAATIKQDKITQINAKEGMRGVFHVSLDAREYQGRWYNSIELYRVEEQGTMQQPSAPATQPAQPVMQPQAPAYPQQQMYAQPVQYTQQAPMQPAQPAYGYQQPPMPTQAPAQNPNDPFGVYGQGVPQNNGKIPF